jgi:hypothetical protein
MWICSPSAGGQAGKYWLAVEEKDLYMPSRGTSFSVLIAGDPVALHSGLVNFHFSFQLTLMARQCQTGDCILPTSRPYLSFVK